jgi:thioredoxin-dependent peroxiredoxin
MVTLKEGDKAPAFTGLDQDGNNISLAVYKGQKLALVFYAEDGSPTCTIQACNLRDNFTELERAGIAVLAVGPDDAKKHKKFETKYQLPYPLIDDSSHEVMLKYGVWDQKKLFGHEYMGVLRTTFLIDEKGIIRKIFIRPKNKAHAEEILEAWKSL